MSRRDGSNSVGFMLFVPEGFDDFGVGEVFDGRFLDGICFPVIEQGLGG